MMMDKRLLNVVPDSKKYIMRNVLCQWGALAANIVMMWNITALLASLLVPEPVNKVWAVIWIVLAGTICMYNIKQPHELFIFQSGQKDT